MGWNNWTLDCTRYIKMEDVYAVTIHSSVNYIITVIKYSFSCQWKFQNDYKSKSRIRFLFSDSLHAALFFL